MHNLSACVCVVKLFFYDVHIKIKSICAILVLRMASLKTLHLDFGYLVIKQNSLSSLSVITCNGYHFQSVHVTAD